MATKKRIHVVPVVVAEEDIQRVVYGLVHQTVMRMLGPGGTFAVAVRTDESDALFAEMVAETLAWEVAADIESAELPSARLSA